MYLKSIIELEEQSIVPLRARIAERLDHSGPTVSQTVARMERDGLLHVSNDRHLELTPEGRRIATEVMRKHVWPNACSPTSSASSGSSSTTRPAGGST